MSLSPEGPGFNPRQSVQFVVGHMALGQDIFQECQFFPVIITSMLHAHPFIHHQCYNLSYLAVLVNNALKKTLIYKCFKIGSVN